MTFRVSFDGTQGLADAPVVVFRVVARGLAGGGAFSLTSENPDLRVLAETEGLPGSWVLAMPAETAFVELALEVEGDEEGFTLHVVGPTVSDLEIDGTPEGPGGTLWISPTFTAVDIWPTGVCTTLGPGGERLYGGWDLVGCDASDNPSYLVKMAF